MINITACCGCGLRTKNLREAVAHSEDTGHVLSVSGTVRCDAPPSVVRDFNRQKESLVTERLSSQLWEDALNDPKFQDLIPDTRRPGRRS